MRNREFLEVDARTRRLPPSRISDVINAQTRHDLLRLLEELGNRYPEVRFGQLIANLSYLAKEPSNEAIWEVEDEELLAAARKQLAQQADRHSPAA